MEELIIRKRRFPRSDCYRFVPTNRTIKEIGWSRLVFNLIPYSSIPEQVREVDMTLLDVVSIWDFALWCSHEEILSDDEAFDKDFRFDYLKAGFGTDYEWERFLEKYYETGIYDMIRAYAAGVPYEDILPDEF